LRTTARKDQYSEFAHLARALPLKALGATKADAQPTDARAMQQVDFMIAWVGICVVVQKSGCLFLF
jgi:hypothetical protein